MTEPLLSLSPIQRWRRIRRLVREIQGQGALCAHTHCPSEMRAAAALRRETASANVLAELSILEETGVLQVIEECFGLVFSNTGDNRED